MIYIQTINNLVTGCELKTLAIIPARGGSKRIPRKNIRLFCGKPIIAYSIGVALECGLFDEIIVSTDSKEIAEISTEFGANVPTLRPAEFSDDKLGVLEVVAYELRQLSSQNHHPSEICLIYATAPMIGADDLVKSCEIFRSSNIDFVFSAAEFLSPIHRAFTILSDGRARMFQPEYYKFNSQDLPRAYHDAAQFCWGRPSAILDPDAVVFSERSQPFVLPSNRVLDIDTLEDWQRAEWLYRAHRSASLNE